MKTLHEITQRHPTGLTRQTYTTECTSLERLDDGKFHLLYRIQGRPETYELQVNCSWDPSSVLSFRRDIAARGYTQLWWSGENLMRGAYP